jgi:hypothetical protein
MRNIATRFPVVSRRSQLGTYIGEDITNIVEVFRIYLEDVFETTWETKPKSCSISCLPRDDQESSRETSHTSRPWLEDATA